MMKQDANIALTSDEFVAGLAALSASFDTLDYSEPLTECVQLAAEAIQDNFADSGSPHGGAWPARKHIGDGHPLLMDTHALFDAATGHNSASVRTVAAQEAAVGVSADQIPYAGVHEFGWPEKNIPERSYLDVDDERLDQMADELGERIEDALMFRDQ